VMHCDLCTGELERLRWWELESRRDNLRPITATRFGVMIWSSGISGSD
jgi:hypothetical protein